MTDGLDGFAAPAFDATLWAFPADADSDAVASTVDALSLSFLDGGGGGFALHQALCKRRAQAGPVPLAELTPLVRRMWDLSALAPKLIVSSA